MAYTQFKTLEWKGKEFDLYVDDSGYFRAVHKGQKPEVYANMLAGSSSYEELVKTLKRKIQERTTTVRVPFTTITRGQYHVRHGFARGIHAKEGTVLVTYDDGEKDELDRWATTLERLDGEALALVEKAATVVRESAEEAARALKWFTALVKPMELDVDRKVRAEIAEKMKAAEAAA